jgi:hypothetical protein
MLFSRLVKKVSTYMRFFYAYQPPSKGSRASTDASERENLDRLTLSRYVFNLSDLAAVSACIPLRIAQ